MINSLSWHDHPDGMVILSFGSPEMKKILIANRITVHRNKGFNFSNQESPF